MKKHFENCETQEDVKRVYREQAKILHPDNGGNEEDFKELQRQYTEAAESLWKYRRNKDGEIYESASGQTPEEYREIIEALLRFENITIEVIGTWIWVTGATFPIKEELKGLNFSYSGPKKAWYNNGGKSSHWRGTCKNMNAIREKWGVSYKEESKGAPKLA